MNKREAIALLAEERGPSTLLSFLPPLLPSFYKCGLSAGQVPAPPGSGATAADRTALLPSGRHVLAREPDK